MTTPRSFARVDTVAEGTVLVTDEGFTCLPPDQRVLVIEDADGLLLIRCDDGYHYLDGQISDDGTHYVGLYHVD